MDFLVADVPDPTDFPAETVAPGLRTLDGSFRCDICGELYDAPVTISCGHCFCSACIRTSLSNKQECPSCRKAANEVHIRPNPVLESAISAWTTARPFVLQLVRRDVEVRERGAEGNDKGNARKRKRASEWTSSPDPASDNAAGPSGQRPSALQSPSKSRRTAAGRQGVIDLAESDAEDEPVASTSSKDAFVCCPMCSKRVLMKNINSHIDRNCQDPPPPASAAMTWSKIMNKGKNGQQKGKNKKKASDSDDEHPLPLSTYTTLKDRQLKDMLAEHDLPLTGDRANWEQRHQKWVMLFNANLDRSPSNRKTKAELRKELKKWEEERSRKKKAVITDVKGYQVEHKAEFAKLVEAARSSRQSKPPEASKSSSPANLPDQSSPPPSSLIEMSNDIVVDSEGEGGHEKSPSGP
ncbi:hypothetical protein CVT26_005715 [Gymnopilus dilepis]|uniref:Postreplication repair E3 ubiquitin-protein ligase RAD18 n=1 Tax=Gymnopilus dilepis TaxID=231916 RepID=A0A409YSM4_9AGAR|nr:hypothetical protein CVT26_005715 [Gymnopilus dilepis]